MKKICYALKLKNTFTILLLSTFLCYSQDDRNISWKSKITKTTNSEYDIELTANIKDKYRLYSQNVPKDGPIPTAFNYKKNRKYKLIGETKESKGETKYDPVFEKEIKTFENEAVFKQTIQALGRRSFKVNVEITYMTCNDISCIKGTREIELVIK